jgi:glucosamine-6-phosphate deaminase
MEIIVLRHSLDAARLVADRVQATLAKKPSATLGLATGSTQLQFYEELKSRHHAGAISFREATTFNLDEYIGIDPVNPQSYRSYMNRELFDDVDIDKNRTFMPICADNESPRYAGKRYEKAIVKAGRINLQILGIGRNGHIGFNEPTSSLASRTRVKTLSQSTIEANSRLFSADEFQPELAMTMGIGTILDSRRVILLAIGSEKADAVRNCVEGPLSSMCPASALQMHRQATVVLDADAAASLSQLDYYKWVHEKNTTILAKYNQ